MLEALLITAVIAAALVCPVTMWLGRRGIGPGCTLMRSCAPRDVRPESELEKLRQRQNELAAQIAEIESARR